MNDAYIKPIASIAMKGPVLSDARAAAAAGAQSKGYYAERRRHYV
jgi:hypothetical protein